MVTHTNPTTSSKNNPAAEGVSGLPLSKTNPDACAPGAKPEVADNARTMPAAATTAWRWGGSNEHRRHAIEEIANALELFVPDGQVSELRVIYPGGRVASEFFDGSESREVAEYAWDETDSAQGVYFIFNPVKPEEADEKAKNGQKARATT